MVKPLKTQNFRTSNYVTALKFSEAVLRGDFGEHGSTERNQAVKIGFGLIGVWMHEVQDIIERWKRDALKELPSDLHQFFRVTNIDFDYHGLLMRLMRISWPSMPHRRGDLRI
jgi:hypothetical protein